METWRRRDKYKPLSRCCATMFLLFVKILGEALSGDKLHQTSDRPGFCYQAALHQMKNAVDRIGQQKRPSTKLQKRCCFIWNYFYLCRAVPHARPDALWRVCGTALAANRPWRLSARVARPVCTTRWCTQPSSARRNNGRDAANPVIGETVAIPLIQCP